MQHASFALADTLGIQLSEQRCGAVGQGGKKILRPLGPEPWCERRSISTRLQSGAHRVCSQQLIELLHHGMRNCATALPGKDLVPKPLPKFSRGSNHMPGPGRFSPSALQCSCYTRTDQMSCAIPAQERAEISK